MLLRNAVRRSLQLAQVPQRQYTQLLAAEVALPPLPYAADALGEAYSAKTFSYHHGKHHKAYVDKCLELTKGTDLEGKSVGEVINASDGVLFNQAAQIFNHSFFWHCMAPGGGGAPAADSALGKQINKDFGSYDNFVAEFGKNAAGNFGSGWTWLVMQDGKLSITNTGNAGTPVKTPGQHPILTVDVWEHAYYLDYQNRRPDYVSTFFEKLVNWSFAEENFAKAQ